MVTEVFFILLLTGYDNVKPIFEKRCAQCHGSNWPDKNWTDEKTAKANAAKIQFRLENKTMPPGNTTGLTDEERQKLIDWAKGVQK